jgi:hypothetical protein
MSSVPTGLKRVRYFTGQLLSSDDLKAEQEYFREKLRRHNRMLHGFGVVCGLKVSAPEDGEPPWQITVSPGYALTPGGDEIVVTEAVRLVLDSALGGPQAGSKRIYIAMRYNELPADPVPGPGGLEPSRIMETFEVGALLVPPPSYQTHLGKSAQDPATDQESGVGALSGCMGAVVTDAAAEDSWIVVAEISLPSSPNERIQQNSISEALRHQL